MTASCEALARRVCEGWHHFREDDYREVFAEGCIYQNMPIPGVQRGPDAIAATLAALGGGYDIELRIDNLVATTERVMVERTEFFTPRTGGDPFNLPVVGVFEAAQGQIQAWRDYFHFDPQQWATEAT